MDVRMLLDLRRILSRASGATSRRLLRAERMGTVLGEETLTEMMVLEILEMLRNGPTGFELETYNHHQEAQNGADLRIWLNLDDAVIGFSIQCKKATQDDQLRTVAQSLDHLVGKAKKRQVDILAASSVHDLSNPIHLIYQSPSLGGSLGLGGGCYAMSTYLMNLTMSGAWSRVDKTDLQNYKNILFPWGTLVAPPVPGWLTVPWTTVPRSPRTHADMIDMFGSLGVDLGAGSYGFGQGAYEYGLKAMALALPGSGGGGGPDDGPDDDGGGDGSGGPIGGSGDGGHGSGDSAEELPHRGEADQEMPRDGAPAVEGAGDEQEKPQDPRRGDRSSLLYRSAPRRVLHIGEPMEVGDYGTPLSVLEQKVRLQEVVTDDGASRH